MNSSNLKLHLKHSTRVWRWATITAIATLLFGWVYFFEPLQLIQPADYWNDKINDGMLIAVALATAILSTRFARLFSSSEPPRRVWLWFSFGWWAWLGGEISSLVYDAIYWSGKYPEFSVSDVFWLSGYVCFGLALYYQLWMIYAGKKTSSSLYFFGLIALALLLTAALTVLARQVGLGRDISWWALYLSTLYPVLDLFEGAAALWLFFLFGLGYLGRPWWGLIVFILADGLTIFFWIGGYEWLPKAIYLALDTLAAIAYFVAYSLSGLALLALHEHLKHGILASPK